MVDAIARHDVEDAQSLAAAHIENAANIMYEALREIARGK